MSSLIGLPASSEFQIGFVIGLAGLAVTVLLRRRRLDWAIVWTVCALAGLMRTGFFGVGRPVRSLDLEPWLLVAALAVCSVAAIGLARARAHPYLAAGFAVSMLAAWATVPDTEAVSVLVGVTGAMIWSWWPLRFAFPGVLGGGTATATAALATIIGGGRREAAIVGGLGILATLGSLGLLERWFRRASAPLDVGFHIALVTIWFMAPRVLSGTVWVFVGAAIASSLVIGAAWIVASRTRPLSNEVEDSGDDPFPPGHIE